MTGAVLLSVYVHSLAMQFVATLELEVKNEGATSEIRIRRCWPSETTFLAVSFPWLSVIVFETYFECMLCWQPRTIHCDLYVGLVACCTIFVTTVGWLAFRGIGAVATMKLTALMWHAVDGSMKIGPWSARAPKWYQNLLKIIQNRAPASVGQIRGRQYFCTPCRKLSKHAEAALFAVGDIFVFVVS